MTDDACDDVSRADWTRRVEEADEANADPLAPGRGLIWGLALGLLLWIFVIWALLA